MPLVILLSAGVSDVRAQEPKVLAAPRGHGREELDRNTLRRLLADAHVQVDELVLEILSGHADCIVSSVPLVMLAFAATNSSNARYNNSIPTEVCFFLNPCCLR